MAHELNRDELFADRSLVGTVFCRAYARRADEWLEGIYSERVGDDRRFALVAVGGYGRGTLSPQSDLDLMLVHDAVEADQLADVSQKLWYPIWDEGLKLGHAVRTIPEAAELASTDLDTATSMISLRKVAGNDELVARLAERTESSWHKKSKVFLPQLADAAAGRRSAKGEVAFLLEPDLKDGSGGLRDVDAIGWAEAAGIPLLTQEVREVREAREVLLAARVELHRLTGRASNVLLLEDQDEVADRLGIGDADQMMRSIATAARTIAWIGDDLWARVRRRGKRKALRRFFSPKIERVAEGVTMTEGTIAVTSTADAGRDPVLVLRVAEAAARHRARIDRDSLDLLAVQSAPMPEPWPDEARELFVSMLATGHASIPVIEALDHTGSWGALVPEWEPNRNRPQRNAYHRFTVDRHLCEAVAEAAELVDQVDRPDLLLVGALLHDIGKGYPGDHSILGMGLVETIATRMGFPRADVEALMTMVQHHLLVPDAATRLDVEDPGTIRMVAEAIGDAECAYLLGALTAADSIATGPSAWSQWKGGLVRDLIDRVARHLDGADLDEIPKQFPTDEQRAMIARGEPVIAGAGHQLTVLVPDAAGLVSSVAGALAANRLDVRTAAVHSDDAMALQQFVVDHALGQDIDWETVSRDVELAVEGRLEIDERIAERIEAYGQHQPQAPQPIVSTYVDFNNEVADEFTVIEVGAPDQIGLLYRIAQAITRSGLSIAQARVQSLGDHVVDSFYVRRWGGGKVTDPAECEEIRAAILGAVRHPASA